MLKWYDFFLPLGIISDAFFSAFQRLLNAIAHIPSLETLHALMLLCWLEQSHHRLPGFRTYYAMATKMAADLGLQDPHNIDLYPHEYERNRRRNTWTGMVTLHMTANSCAFMFSIPYVV